MKSIAPILITLIAIVVCSCSQGTEEITWKVDQIATRLVVEGSITTELKKHQVKLTKSADYFSNKKCESVINAQVTINDGTNQIILMENPLNSGFYETIEETQGIPGKTYTLQIDLKEPVNNTTHYSATSRLNPGIRFDSLQIMVYDFKIPFSEDSVINFSLIFGQEPTAIGDFYMVRYYKNNILLNDTITKVYIYQDEIDGINNQKVILFTFNEDYTLKDSISLEISSINKTYYDYLTAIGQINQGVDPMGFSGPVANAVGNINGGDAFGFFIAMDVSKRTAIPVHIEDVKK